MIWLFAHYTPSGHTHTNLQGIPNWALLTFNQVFLGIHWNMIYVVFSLCYQKLRLQNFHAERTINFSVLSLKTQITLIYCYVYLSNLIMTISFSFVSVSIKSRPWMHNEQKPCFKYDKLTTFSPLSKHTSSFRVPMDVFLGLQNLKTEEKLWL